MPTINRTRTAGSRDDVPLCGSASAEVGDEEKGDDHVGFHALAHTVRASHRLFKPCKGEISGVGPRRWLGVRPA